MNKTIISAMALAAALSVGGAGFSQVPSGGAGSDAKGNAPLKHAHTVNDGGARKGRNSFTEGQARQHIVKAGYDSVSGLAKGKDGVWRGTAMKGGAPVQVGMDFKGNVSEGEAAASTAEASSTSTTTTRSASSGASTGGDMATGAASSGAAPAEGAAPASTVKTSAATGRHHHRRHHGATSRCANPSPNGAACSGVDRNKNGVSDKEDRAIKAGAHP